MPKKIDVPVKDKFCLTVDEAAAYFQIGTDRLRNLIDQPSSKYVLRVGNQKKLIIRDMFEEYLRTVGAV